MEINVVVVGLGAIGRPIARSIAARPGLRLVGAVDSSPKLAGRSVSRVVGSRLASDMVVTADLRSTLKEHHRGVAVLTTASRLSSVRPELDVSISAGWNVISSSEELANAWAVDTVTAEIINELAIKRQVSVVGAGINPGFLMDSLPLILASVCQHITKISVRRIVNTNSRRTALQRKVGVGLRPELFSRLARSGSIGHVGLAQSAASIAQHVGWSPCAYREQLKPVIAATDTETGLGLVRAGNVIGQAQAGQVTYRRRKVIELSLEMWAGAAAVDEIIIDGDPPIRQTIDGGVNGDIGTQAIILNAIRPAFDAESGLLTMARLLPVPWQAS